MRGVIILSSEDEQFKKEFTKNKQKAIAKVNRMLSRKRRRTFAEGQEKVVTAAGEKKLTLRDLLKEIEDETEYGVQLVKIMSKTRDKTPKEEET